MKRALAVLTTLLVLGLGTALTQSLPQPERSTASQPDPQVVAGPIPEKITSNSVVVWWQTTAPQESILVYGTAPTEQPYRVQRPWSTRTHEVSLKKLRPGTTYYLAILQPDGTRSAVGQFTTQATGYARDDNLRITNGPLFEQISPDSATITWSANMPSAFVVHYGTDPQKLDQTANAPWTPTTHRVVLASLQPDSQYYFAIEPKEQMAASEPAHEPREQTSPSTEVQMYGFHTLDRGQQALNIGPRH
jgi:hypothetical protein